MVFAVFGNPICKGIWVNHMQRSPKKNRIRPKKETYVEQGENRQTEQNTEHVFDQVAKLQNPKIMEIRVVLPMQSLNKIY